MDFLLKEYFEIYLDIIRRLEFVVLVIGQVILIVNFIEIGYMVKVKVLNFVIIIVISIFWFLYLVV